MLDCLGAGVVRTCASRVLHGLAEVLDPLSRVKEDLTEEALPRSTVWLTLAPYLTVFRKLQLDLTPVTTLASLV